MAAPFLISKDFLIRLKVGLQICNPTFILTLFMCKAAEIKVVSSLAAGVIIQPVQFF